MAFLDIFRPSVSELVRKRDIEGLVRAVKSRNEKIATKVVLAIRDNEEGILNHPKALKVLSAAFDSGSSLVSSIAFNAAIDLHAAELLVGMLKEDCDDSYVKRALREWGGDSVTPLIAALKDENLQIRYNAIGILGDIGDARAVEPLIAVLSHDKEPETRYAAAGALGKIKDSRAVKALVDALNDSGWFTIFDFGDPKFPEERSKLYVWEQAAWALGDLGEKGRRVLKEFTESKSERRSFYEHVLRMRGRD